MADLHFPTTDPFVLMADLSVMVNHKLPHPHAYSAPHQALSQNPLCPHVLAVKNRFSDPTKEQEGRDQQGKDIMNDHQGKALREGCHERKKAWASGSSREKKDTNRNLARVTTKSKSRTQTVSNRRVSRRVKN